MSLESSQHIHNTFLPKDLTWSEKDNNMYLEPVVEAQQVLDLSPQTTHPRKGGQNVIPETRYLVTYPGCYGKVGAIILSENGCTLFSQNIQTVPILSFIKILFFGSLRPDL